MPLPTSTEIRVAIVEDLEEDRQAFKELLSRSPGFVCVAACNSGREALEILPERKPDVVLMDIHLVGMSGIECVRQLRPLLPDAQIMMFTALEDHSRIFGSLEAGAMGYMLKKTTGPKLLEAIKELRGGGAPMSGPIARKVLAAFRQRPRAAESSAKLSAVELSVLERLARGFLYKEVAEDLKVSPSTVRTHVWHIYRKLQVHNRTEAVLKGLSPLRV